LNTRAVLLGATAVITTVRSAQEESVFRADVVIDASVILENFGTMRTVYLDSVGLVRPLLVPYEIIG